MKATPSRPVIRDPMGVIPEVPTQVEVRRDSRGMVHLRSNIEPTGLVRHIVRWTRYDYRRTVELDDYGSAFFSRVDGRVPLRTIITEMAAQFGRPYDEMESSVVLFTKKLMQMQMICLRVPTALTEDLDA